MRISWVGLLAVGGLVLTASPGVAAASPAPVVVQARSSTPVTLPDAGGTLGSVVGFRLTKGSWTVSSNITAVNFGGGDYVRCQLQENGHLIDGGATAYLADRVGGLVDVGTFVASGPVAVAVLCDHDRAAGSSGQFYIDPGATITAVRGGPIQAPGLTPSGAPTVVQTRSTSAVSLTDGDYLPVAAESLPTGTWAITANGSAVDFSSQDFVACSLGVSAGSITVSYPQAGTGGDDAVVTDLDAEAVATIPAGGGQVTLYCATAFDASTYMDAGATITATKVAPTAVKSAPIPQRALPNAGGAAKVVFKQTIPAGAWRVRTEVSFGLRFPNNGYGPARDFLRCSLAANGQPIDGGATNLVSFNTYIGQLVNAGSFTSPKAWTLTLSCSHDATHSGSGVWTTVDGEMQTVNRGPIN
jgi:hypothetical protein